MVACMSWFLCVGAAPAWLAEPCVGAPPRIPTSNPALEAECGNLPTMSQAGPWSFDICSQVFSLSFCGLWVVNHREASPLQDYVKSPSCVPVECLLSSFWMCLSCALLLLGAGIFWAFAEGWARLLFASWSPAEQARWVREAVQTWGPTAGERWVQEPAWFALPWGTLVPTSQCRFVECHLACTDWFC